MSIYGAAAAATQYHNDFTQSRIDDSLQAIQQLQNNPQQLQVRLSYNEDYLTFANSIESLILRNLNSIQL